MPHCCYLPLHPDADLVVVQGHRIRRLGDVQVIYCDSAEDARQVSQQLPGSTCGEYTHGLGSPSHPGEY
jgi:hypothetical protein